MGVFVEVLSAHVDTREGRNDNGMWKSRTQEAFVHQGGPYPTPFTIRLDENQMPFQPGKYVFGPGCFRLGKFGLELARSIDLMPVDEAIKRLQAVASGRPLPSSVAA